MSERYSRQTILPEIGEAGQQKLGSSHIAIVETLNAMNDENSNHFTYIFDIFDSENVWP